MSTIGFATPLAAYLRGRNTPIKPGPEDLKARMEQEKFLREQILEVEKLKNDIRTEGIDAWQGTQRAAITAKAQMLNGLANAAQARAMGAQAKAFMWQAARDLTAESGPLYFEIGDKKILSEHLAATATAVNGFAPDLQKDGGKSFIEEMTRGAMGKPLIGEDGALSAEGYAAFKQVMDVKIGQPMLAAIDSAANTLPQGGKRANTIVDMVDQQSQALLDTFNQSVTDPEARRILGAAVHAYAGDLGQAVAGKYQGDLILKGDQMARAHEYVRDFTDQATKMGISTGEVSAMADILNDATDAMITTPQEMGKELARMPTPDSLNDMQIDLEAQLAALKMQGLQESDPVFRGINDIVNAVGPGFPNWMKAMRFPNMKRAAMYAANHPDELIFLKQQVAADPTLADPQNADKVREVLRSQRDNSSFGYYTTRLARAVPLPRKAGGDGEEVAPEAGTPTPAAATPAVSARMERKASRSPFQPAAADIEVEAPEEEITFKESAPEEVVQGKPTLNVHEPEGVSLRPVVSPYLQPGAEGRIVKGADGTYLHEGPDATFTVLTGEQKGTRIDANSPEYVDTLDAVWTQYGTGARAPGAPGAVLDLSEQPKVAAPVAAAPAAPVAAGSASSGILSLLRGMRKQEAPAPATADDIEFKPSTPRPTAPKVVEPSKIERKKAAAVEDVDADRAYLNDELGVDFSDASDDIVIETATALRGGSAPKAGTKAAPTRIVPSPSTMVRVAEGTE